MSNFTINGDGTVIDNEPGLMWQQQNDKEQRTWREALDYAGSLTLGGYSDWRLPTRFELESILDLSRYNPAIDTMVFPGTALACYDWSSSDYAGNTYYAWHVNFCNGHVGHNGKSSRYYARCVRSIK